MFLASCSKSECFECLEKGIDTQVCKEDVRFNQVQDKQKALSVLGVNTAEYFAVSTGFKCKFKD